MNKALGEQTVEEAEGEGGAKTPQQQHSTKLPVSVLW